MGLDLSKEISITGEPYNLDFLDDPEIRKTMRRALKLDEPVSTDLIVSNQVSGNRPRTLASIEIEKEIGAERLNSLQIWSARRALTGLVLAESFGYINFSNIRRILDFGAGMGGPTFALVSVGGVIDAEVEAVEVKSSLADVVVETGILPRDRVLGGRDGFTYLNSLPEQGIQPYDLITSFMFGPDREGDLFFRLTRAAQRSLAPTGFLLITSDPGTILAAELSCRISRVIYHRTNGIWEDNDEVAPDVLILPRQSCGRIILY